MKPFESAKPRHPSSLGAKMVQAGAIGLMGLSMADVAGLGSTVGE